MLGKNYKIIDPRKLKLNAEHWSWWFLASVAVFCYFVTNKTQINLRNPFRANFKLVRVLLTHNALIILSLKPAMG